MNQLTNSEFMPVFILALLDVSAVVGTLLVGKLIRPTNKENELKNSPYECGEPTIGATWINFNIRFYLIAIIL